MSRELQDGEDVKLILDCNKILTDDEVEQLANKGGVEMKSLTTAAF